MHHVNKAKLTSSDTGSIKQEHLIDDYLARICERHKTFIDPLRIGIDCGNGVAGPAALTSI